ncbi:hypothetical protein [Litoreibacter albidus]|uniref:Uncharacterized protein n=1 Tax=Litoreibacter albidus TaxID=670155 RepID=A0A1H2XG71_9RHOB|nr:hypothetical protein [Litoreibacter albidus]SDW91718.1 hypothetical protein SAMN04488001_1967 [Litoreibacter albidus]
MNEEQLITADLTEEETKQLNAKLEKVKEISKEIGAKVTAMSFKGKIKTLLKSLTEVSGMRYAYGINIDAILAGTAAMETLAKKVHKMTMSQLAMVFKIASDAIAAGTQALIILDRAEKEISLTGNDRRAKLIQIMTAKFAIRDFIQAARKLQTAVKNELSANRNGKTIKDLPQLPKDLEDIISSGTAGPIRDILDEKEI